MIHTTICDQCNSEVIFRNRNIIAECIGTSNSFNLYTICPNCGEHIPVRLKKEIMEETKNSLSNDSSFYNTGFYNSPININCSSSVDVEKTLKDLLDNYQINIPKLEKPKKIKGFKKFFTKGGNIPYTLKDVKTSSYFYKEFLSNLENLQKDIDRGLYIQNYIEEHKKEVPSDTIAYWKSLLGTLSSFINSSITDINKRTKELSEIDISMQNQIKNISGNDLKNLSNLKSQIDNNYEQFMKNQERV